MKEDDNNLKIKDIKPIDLDKCERMQKIIRYYKMSQTELAERLDVNQSNLSAILRGKRPCGKIMDDKFLLSFPEVNKEWFLTGEGSMLNEGYTTFDAVGVATPNSSASQNIDMEILKVQLEEKVKLIESYEKELTVLRETNKSLLEIVMSMTKATEQGKQG